MASTGTLPSGTTVNIGLGGYVYTGNLNKTPGTLDLNGTNQSINVLQGTGIVTNNNNTASDPSILTIGLAGGSGQFYGTIQDGSTNKVSIVKNGAGLLILGSASTYSGGTTVTGGTLRLAQAGTGVLQMPGAGTQLFVSGSGQTAATAILNGPVGTGPLTLNGGSTLQDSGYATNLANAVSVNGSVTFSSPSATTIFGSPNSGSLLIDGTALGTPTTFATTGASNLAVNNTTTIVDQITVQTR